jgi:hypothetical protein
LFFFLLLSSVPAICNVERDLKDSSGNYLKSVCTVYQDQTYDDAVKMCADNGMKIYNAASAASANAVIGYSDIQWPFGTFWIDGKSGSNCAVVTNDKRINFATANISCVAPNLLTPPPKNYFHCEFICEFSLIVVLP